MKYFADMPMYYGAKPELFEYAKTMRHAPTETEKLMWDILKGGAFREYRFRRQHPISRFIADFYSHQLLLVIELDGGYHLDKHQQQLDEIRDEDMHEFGITVMRFTNVDILTNFDESLNTINLTIAQLKAARTKGSTG